jgi:hypothetical protein
MEGRASGGPSAGEALAALFGARQESRRPTAGAGPATGGTRAASRQWVAGLTFTEAERLLDWLEVRGVRGTVEAQPDGVFTVRWEKPGGA